MPLISPIDSIEHTHLGHARLCDQLEQIADALPKDVDTSLCWTVVDILMVDLPVHHRDEEEGLFPLLEKRAVPEDNIERHLDQLRTEHAMDEGVAAELLEFLPRLAKGERPQDPDIYGYILRCFFESYRRHLSWEQNLIVPLARQRLLEEDLARLTEIMGAHRRLIGH